MPGRWRKLCAVLGLSLPLFLLSIPGSRAQLPAQPEVVASAEPAVPKGVEVLARGPVHEAFASLADSAPPSVQVKKKPPDALEEMPPDEKPEGDVVWIGGYWAWDDDRTDFLWVSGIWRVQPPEKRWVA